MAYNALYGYDTGQYGFGPANGTSASADGVVQPLQRTYPAWMQDINARGIGVDSSNDQGIPAFTPLNSGPLTDPTPPAAAPAAASLASAAAPKLSGDTAFEGGGNGGGAAEQQDVNGGTGGQNLGPSPGSLPDIFGLGPSVTDIASINVGGLQAGDITGGTGGAPTDPNASNGGLSPGGMDLATAAANGGMGDITGNGGNQGGGGGPDIGAAGDQTAEARGSAKGGIITRNKLVGPNPPGPDSGYGKLELGEGVLTDKAIKFYGKGIVARLNRLEVPKARLRA